MESLAIADGGIIQYHQGFFSKELADELFKVIKEKTPWKQYKNFPRLTAWYANSGLTYSYSGVTHHGLEWADYLLEVKKRIEQAASAKMNSLLLNYYRHGNDSIGYHTDAEPELGKNPIIPSVSFGAEREFVLKHIKTGNLLKFKLKHGSLLVMAGTTQHHWYHAVPKTRAETSERINLTFRNIV